MSVLIHVDAYSGYRANERPIRFWLDAIINENELTGVYEIEAVEDGWYDPNEIEAVEDGWYDPNAEYFKVRTTEGKKIKAVEDALERNHQNISPLLLAHSPRQCLLR